MALASAVRCRSFRQARYFSKKHIPSRRFSDSPVFSDTLPYLSAKSRNSTWLRARRPYYWPTFLYLASIVDWDDWLADDIGIAIKPSIRPSIILAVGLAFFLLKPELLPNRLLEVLNIEQELGHSRARCRQQCVAGRFC